MAILNKAWSLSCIHAAEYNRPAVTPSQQIGTNLKKKVVK